MKCIQKNGDRITGSLEPFQTEELKMLIGNILQSKNSVAVQQLEILRENSKIAIALRMQPAVAKSFVKTMIISDRSLNVIERNLIKHHHEADVGFVCCTLRYFSGQRRHNITIDLNCSCCKSNDSKKSLTHARKDCEKYSEKYIGKVYKKLKNDPWTNLSEDDLKEQLSNYQSMDYSIKFVCSYLTELCIGKLPPSLGINVYEEACDLDPAIANYYHYNEGLTIYQRKRIRNYALTLVNQECATYLFCRNYIVD